MMRLDRLTVKPVLEWRAPVLRHDAPQTRRLLVEYQRHAQRVGGALDEPVPRVELTAWQVGEQAHVRVSWRTLTDLFEKIRQHGAAQAATLVLRHDGHVHHVEVPAPI